MAQPIYCDWEGCEDHADLLVSRLADGETLAWCQEHWGAFVTLTAQQLGADVGPGLDIDQLQQDGAQGPSQDQDAAADAAALERLEALSQPRTAGEAADVPGAQDGTSAAPGPAGDPVGPSGERPSEQAMRETEAERLAIQPAEVVRRGTSPSRRRHEARKRDKARAAQETERPE